MERCERPPPLPPHRRSRSKNPSFSSSLLDVIYRSIDQEQQPEGEKAHRGAPDRSLLINSEEEEQRLRTPRSSSVDQCCRLPKPTPRASHRPACPTSVNDARRRRFAGGIASSSSSSCSFSSSSTATTAAATTTTSCSSNSTGFSSSSDAESIRRVLLLDPPGQEKQQKKKNSKCGSIRSGLRGFRKGRGPMPAAAPPGNSPASPGARLASFLNALFSAAGSPKKTKIVTTTASSTTAVPKVSIGGDESACSTSPASSCRRSCLSKAPPSQTADRRRMSGAEEGKRSVRFYPVSVIVDEDSRPCGHKRLQDEAVAARMEELLRAAEEEEEDEEGSESSSDLFELENLTVVMEGRRRSYGDELPVYETTDVHTNLAIAQGLMIH
ncbi:hypothetical protein Cni_G28993 [Canna indica]|uniref:Uncharacterized protein n=1 Tax=Canna indica TaxID=4628 RepID=A0AAQ3QTK5_9LILI|nr:hypothetical protein Cni_G28993 [Canna indica]